MKFRDYLETKSVNTPDKSFCQTIITSNKRVSFTATNGSEGNAVLADAYTGWTSNITLNGSKWIWAEKFPSKPSKRKTFTFTRKFDLNGDVFGIDSAWIWIAADNVFTALLNNCEIGASWTGDNWTLDTQKLLDIPFNCIRKKNNILTIIGTTNVYSHSNDGAAGILFYLYINSTSSHLNI